MTTSKQDILSNLKNDLWDLNTVAAVVETKKAARNLKGEAMNFFVLKRDFYLTADAEEHTDELIEFMNALKKNISDFKDGTRIQLAVQSDAHWFPIDLEIMNQNLSVLMPEAGFTPSTWYATYAILAQFPEANIYRFYPDNRTIDGRDRTFMIQSDGESCSRFALQQLFALQKISDLHQKLTDTQPLLSIAYLDQITPIDDKTGLPLPDAEKKNIGAHYAITFSNCPAEISAIFKSTQSPTSFDLTSQEAKQHIINKKGETLAEYHRRHAWITPEKKQRNYGIFDFQEKQIQTTQNFLTPKTEEEVQNLLARNKRNGQEFLNGGSQYRDQLEIDQKQKKNLDYSNGKAARDMFLKKINHYCRDKNNGLQPFKLSFDPKIVHATSSLIDRLESIRVDMMLAQHSNGTHLTNTYHKHVKALLDLDKKISKILPPTQFSQNLLKDIKKMTQSKSKISIMSTIKAIKNKVSYLRMSSEDIEIYKFLQAWSRMQTDTHIQSHLNEIAKNMLGRRPNPAALLTALNELHQQKREHIIAPEHIDDLIARINQTTNLKHS